MAYVFQTRGKNGKAHARWRFQYTDYVGHRRTATGTTSKIGTVRLAERVQAENDAIRKGLQPVPTTAAKNGTRPLTEVMDEYLAWGESQGGRGGRPWGPGHARMRRSILTWWRDQLTLETVAKLEGSLPRIEQNLRTLREQGRTGKTLRNYAECIKGFCNWCKARGYLAGDPLRALAKFDATPQTRRRAMTQEEIIRLVETAPEERKLLYEVAFCTGLRAGELRALSSADLDSMNCGLRLHPEWTKNRKPGFQPLPRTLVQNLRVFAESGRAERLYRKYNSRKNSKRNFPKYPLLFVPRDPAGSLDRDLNVAGISKWTSEGKVDFHACRVAFVTFIIEAGATVKEAQSLARHATSDLTLNVYARVRSDRLSRVVEEVGSQILHQGNTTGTQRENTGALTHSGIEGYMVNGAGLEPAATGLKVRFFAV